MRALGATISGVRYRRRLHSEIGWAEFSYSKWLLAELSFSDCWSRATKTLGTRLAGSQIKLLAIKLFMVSPLLLMINDVVIIIPLKKKPLMYPLHSCGSKSVHI